MAYIFLTPLCDNSFVGGFGYWCVCIATLFFFWLAGFCWALLLNGCGVFDACFLVVVCRLDRLVGNFSSSLFFFFWQSLVYEVLKDKVSKR